MAEELQSKSQKLLNTSNKLQLALVAIFFLGLFLFAFGIGQFLFGNSKEGDIQIISNDLINQNEGLPAGKQVMVHVDGAVVSPGVYELAQDSRVADAIEAAGGLDNEADRSRVNLAAKVSDGQKVYIPAVNESTGQSVKGESSGLININTASESELEKLPGIGPVTAQKIVDSRPYSALEELLTKKVVGNATFEKIKEMISF